MLREIVKEDADIIAFSVYLWNVEEILKLSENIKKIKKDVKIILGGPEVTYQSEKILKENPTVDYVIIGEGEETFPALINYLDGSMNEMPQHVSYRIDDRFNIGEIGLVCDTNKIPRIAQSIADGYDGRIVYIETVRGCPEHRSYCQVYSKVRASVFVLHPNV